MLLHTGFFYKRLELDIKIISTYPRVSQLLNISRETVVMEFSAIRGVSEHNKREIGVNLTGGRTNALEVTQKALGAATLDQMLASYVKHKANGSTSHPKLHG